MSGYIPKGSEKTLWYSSGGLCYLCKTSLVFSDKSNTLGEQAHIYGEKPNSARYCEEKAKDENFINSHKNLILACPTCHKKIDKTHIEEYPTEKLFEIKEQHESKLQKAVIKEMLEFDSITFIELEDVYNQFKLPETIKITNISMPIPPNKKIDKNKLSQNVHEEIQIAYSQIPKFGEFVNNHPKIGFSSKLKQGFINKYILLVDEGYRGDEIYNELKIFATGGKPYLSRQVGAIIILAYYFECCDIFES
jgi:hypothetical protein